VSAIFDSYRSGDMSKLAFSTEAKFVVDSGCFESGVASVRGFYYFAECRDHEAWALRKAQWTFDTKSKSTC
jgi:hypothetical protein